MTFRLSAQQALSLAQFVCCGAAMAAVLTLLSACANSPTDDRTQGWSPNKVYDEARDEAKSGAWDRAIVLYEKLEGRAAGTPLAQQAQLEKAYAQYKTNDNAMALATLERFKKLHPASPGMDYALYLQGLANFNDRLGILGSVAKVDLSERDQNAAKESFESFKELVTRFPDSRYASDARSRMIYIVNSLAQYEVHVARFYFDRGAYVAAINRAQTAVTDYQNVPAAEEALFILVRSYEALGMPQLAADAQRVLLQNFPQSEMLARGGRAKTAPWWQFW